MSQTTRFELWLATHDYVKYSTYEGVNGLGYKTYKVTFLDGRIETWEVREDDAVYVYNESGDKCGRILSLKDRKNLNY